MNQSDEQIALRFFEAMYEMINAGRPAWKELQQMCDADDINVSEVIAWLEDIDGSVKI